MFLRSCLWFSYQFGKSKETLIRFGSFPGQYRQYRQYRQYPRTSKGWMEIKSTQGSLVPIVIKKKLSFGDIACCSELLSGKVRLLPFYLRMVTEYITSSLLVLSRALVNIGNPKTFPIIMGPLCSNIQIYQANTQHWSRINNAQRQRNHWRLIFRLRY